MAFERLIMVIICLYCLFCCCQWWIWFCCRWKLSSGCRRRLITFSLCYYSSYSPIGNALTVWIELGDMISIIDYKWNQNIAGIIVTFIVIVMFCCYHRSTRSHTDVRSYVQAVEVKIGHTRLLSMDSRGDLFCPAFMIHLHNDLDDIWWWLGRMFENIWSVLIRM